VDSNADTAAVAWDAAYTGSATIKVKEINSCGEGDFSDVLDINIYSLPEVNLGENQTLCGVEEYELDAGNPGSTYLWSTGETTQKIMASGEGSTEFYVMVSNSNGCSSGDSIVLNFAAMPEVNLGADTVICHTSTITLDAGNPGSTYDWSTGETTQTITVDAADYEYGMEDFSCEVTNSDGCKSSDEITLEIKDCTGIDEISDGLSLQVFPNPNNGLFNLKIESHQNKTINIKVMSVTGKMVYQEDNVRLTGSFNKQIDLSNLAEGVYSVFVSSEGNISSKKIVVRK
jgi:hypothetical protein